MKDGQILGYNNDNIWYMTYNNEMTTIQSMNTTYFDYKQSQYSNAYNPTMTVIHRALNTLRVVLTPNH